MSDKPKSQRGDASSAVRLGAAQKLEESSRQDLATALAHERTLLRTMIDLIPAFIYAKDVGSRFIAMNAALARNMGTRAEDAIGRTDFDFFTRDLAQKFPRVQFLAVYSGQDSMGGVEAREHFEKTARFGFPIVRDEGATLADRFGAIRTPHAFVLGSEGEIFYQGSVDDKRTSEPTRRYLEAALNALGQGRVPEWTRTRPMGCRIER